MGRREDDSDSSWVRSIGLGLGVVLALLALAMLVRGFLAKPEARRPGVQQIALIKQPPPPPPKPPEKPPEPPKVKEEVKLPEPKAEPPKPDAPKPADDKPAPDKPLGLDADGSAGSDGFGLAANRGGRDLVLGGGGGGGGTRGNYYSGLLQRAFFEALAHSAKVQKQEFRVVVRIWLGEDGRVQRSEFVTGSGQPEVDELIRTTLAEMSPLRDVPPAELRQLQLRLANRS